MKRISFHRNRRHSNHRFRNAATCAVICLFLLTNAFSLSFGSSFPHRKAAGSVLLHPDDTPQFAAAGISFAPGDSIRPLTHVVPNAIRGGTGGVGGGDRPPADIKPEGAGEVGEKEATGGGGDEYGDSEIPTLPPGPPEASGDGGTPPMPGSGGDTSAGDVRSAVVAQIAETPSMTFDERRKRENFLATTGLNSFGTPNGGAWAVLNLLLAALSGGVAAFALLNGVITGGARMAREPGFAQMLLSAICAAVSVVTFMLTENTALRPACSDRFSPLMAVLFATCAICAICAARVARTRKPAVAAEGAANNL